jgi:hypothetical protein
VTALTASVRLAGHSPATAEAMCFRQSGENVMRIIAPALLAALVVAQAHAATSSFTTIDNFADPTFNQLLGINNAGVISGYFGLGSVGHPNKGYTVAPPYTNFKADNLPGSVQTQATGITTGQATSGFWSPTNLGGGDANFGFIRWVSHGKFTYLSLNDPLVSSSPAVNQVLGVNAANIAVGFYNDSNNMPHGYVYTVSTGRFTPVNVPGAVSDAATGINSRNLICGFYTGPGGRTLGFLKPLTSGTAIHFGVPGSATTQFLGVNAHGIAVGFYMGGDQLPHGVLYNPTNGNWTPVNDPSGVMGTVLNGINDKGQIVGFYTDAAGNTHGMLVNGLVP